MYGIAFLATTMIEQLNLPSKDHLALYSSCARCTRMKLKTNYRSIDSTKLATSHIAKGLGSLEENIDCSALLYFCSSCRLLLKGNAVGQLREVLDQKGYYAEPVKCRLNVTHRRTCNPTMACSSGVSQKFA